jgi:hypothetical protein
MKHIATVFLVVSVLVIGASAKKRHNESDYVSGTLMGKQQISLGTSCSGSSGDCDPVIRYRYTVVSEGVEYVLAPIHRAGMFSKESVLSGQRPGTTVKVLLEKGSTVFVKVPGDERESRYEIVGSSAAK